MQNLLNISIHQPCHEKWEEMTLIEKGAYCKSCRKEVTDFTAMSDEELANYFQNKNNQTSCGRFRNDQLNRPVLYISPDVLHMNIPLWKKFIAALFICFSSFIVGCNNEKKYSAITTLEPPSVTQTIRVEPTRETDTKKISSNTATKKKKLKSATKNELPMPDIITYTLGFVQIKHLSPETAYPEFAKYILQKPKN